jgi:hypothetical protein
MDVAVVYESMFGNTETIAEAIAAGVREADPNARVTVSPVAQATPKDVAASALLLVGGPTHMLGMSKQSSRQKAEQTPKDDGSATARPATARAERGVREWLDDLPDAPRGHSAAAFDTRLSYPLAGGAARSIGRGLRHHGYEIVAKPQGFVVDGAQGPLRQGERERAKAWGARVTQDLIHQPVH